MAVASPAVGTHAIVPASSPYNYQVTPTASPTPLASRACYQVTFHAPLSNSGTVVVGGSNLTMSTPPNGPQLGAGDSYTYDISNADQLSYASGDAGQKLNVEVKSL